MNMKHLAVLTALLGLSGAAVAQTFESSVADAATELSAKAHASAQAAKAQRSPFLAQGAPMSYARTIVCAQAPKGSGLPDGLRFYTRLDANPPKKIPTDETAAGLDDYRSAYLEGGKFHYNAWSCDTQDYWFTFDAESLMKTTPRETSRPIKGHARVETRGQVDWEGDLDCVASW